MNAQEALNRLKEGNARFVEDRLDGELQDTPRKQALINGQAPWAIVLSCADSRVVPELAFDSGLGELFVIRVAGNIANKSSMASIEYAVAHLGTKLIVVMGHESCGAVTAAIAGGDNGPNLNHLIEQISPSVSQSTSSDVNAVVKTNAQLNVERMKNDSEIIRNAVKNDGVEIVPAYYNFSTGEVEFI